MLNNLLVKQEDLNTTGLQQKATLDLLSSLCFPQAWHCPTKGKAKAASISLAYTANVSNGVDTDWVFPQAPSLPQAAAQHIPCFLPPAYIRIDLLATLLTNPRPG